MTSDRQNPAPPERRDRMRSASNPSILSRPLELARSTRSADYQEERTENRPRPDLSRMAGKFTSTLPIHDYRPVHMPSSIHPGTVGSSIRAIGPRRRGGLLGRGVSRIRRGPLLTPRPSRPPGKSPKLEDGSTLSTRSQCSKGLSHGVSSVADSCCRNSSGVSLRNSQKLNSGHLQAQQAVRRLTLAGAGPEPPQVPVQPLQVQQPLRHLAVPSLLHPRHAVDALHQAAGTPHPAQGPIHPLGLLSPRREALLQLHRPGQRQAPRRRGRGRLRPRAATAVAEAPPGPATPSGRPAPGPTPPALARPGPGT